MELKTSGIEKCAAFFLTLSVFLLTLWRFGANQCVALVAVMVIVYRPWRRKAFSWQWIKIPVVSVGVLLTLWAVISISYSETPDLLQAIEGLHIYTKLLFLLVLPIAMQSIPQYRKWIENGLIYGVLINVIISSLYYYHIPFAVSYFGPYMSMGATFNINPLQLIYMVVMVIWVLTMRLTYQEGSKIDLCVFILLTVYLWFINIERSGYLLFLVLLLLFLVQQYGKKAILLGCIIIPILLLIFYEVSPNVKARVNLGVHNVIAYQKAENPGSIDSDNSLGLRLAFISETAGLIKQHLMLGTGIGSFKYVHAVLYPEQQKNFPANDPHNAYIYVLFELGLIGLILYLSWLYYIFRFTRSLAVPKDKKLLRGVWLMFVVMGLTDSGLALNAIAISFIMWLSIYLSQKEAICSLP